MAAFRSAPRGDRLVGRGGWAVALLAAWTLPAVAGLAALGLVWVVVQTVGAAALPGGAETALALWGAGWLLALSPLASWIGLAILGPLAWLLLRAGLAGWLNMAAAGAAAGSVAGGALPGFAAEIAMLVGAAAALILRGALGWVAPAALVPGGAAADRPPQPD